MDDRLAAGEAHFENSAVPTAGATCSRTPAEPCRAVQGTISHDEGGVWVLTIFSAFERVNNFFAARECHAKDRPTTRRAGRADSSARCRGPVQLAFNEE